MAGFENWESQRVKYYSKFQLQNHIILQLQITIENYIFLIDKKIKEREKEDGGLLLSIY